jgi:chromosome segregation ATPase
LEKTYSDLQKNIQDVEKERDTYIQQFNSVNEKYINMSKNLDDASNTLLVLRAEKQKLISQNNKLNNSIKELKLYRNTLISQNKKLNNSINELNKELLTLNDKVANLKQSHKDEIELLMKNHANEMDILNMDHRIQRQNLIDIINWNKKIQLVGH